MGKDIYYRIVVVNKGHKRQSELLLVSPTPLQFGAMT